MMHECGASSRRLSIGVSPSLFRKVTDDAGCLLGELKAASHVSGVSRGGGNEVWWPGHDPRNLSCEVMNTIIGSIVPGSLLPTSFGISPSEICRTGRT